MSNINSTNELTDEILNEVVGGRRAVMAPPAVTVDRSPYQAASALAPLSSVPLSFAY